MDPTQESASTYYNKYRKMRFFFSRLTVLTSMIVLIITLVINISLLYSHDKNTITTHAATEQNIQQVLPKLPVGCLYKKTNKNYEVECPTPTPAVDPISINVPLPALPPQCTLESSTSGSKIYCTLPVPIPSVAVTLPSTCQTASQSASVSCIENNKQVLVPLPSLPESCQYKLLYGKNYVECEAR